MSVREIRSNLIDRLRYEIVGPETESEVLKIRPLQKYLAGILWPMKSSLVSDEDEIDFTLGRETAKETFETTAPIAKAMNPSAIGLSFLLDPLNPKINVDVEFGMYEELGEGEWVRIPFSLKSFQINFLDEIGKKRSTRIPRKRNRDVDLSEPIQLEWIVRPFKGYYAVSLFLVNRHVQEVDQHDIDHLCVFQPKIKLESIDNESFIVRNAFSNNDKEFQDEDTKSNALLYRNERVYAVGHSVSVTWKNINQETKKAGFLETEIIPAYEIPMVIPPDWTEGGTLDMRKIGAMKSGVEIVKAIKPLLDKYQEWINERKLDIENEIEEEYKETARIHMQNCQASLDRMNEGLKIIQKDNNVLNAFIFANQVMANQRAHSEAIEKQISPENVKTEWRPFQIAFFLQNIRGIVDPNSKDRGIADLLWFPTGGGKTEAYLGLAAFTIGYRRLMKVNGYRTDVGVSVIMRYTLRLLTIQQFQRAAAMICACEEIRRTDIEKWGQQPFRIGLWVGDNSVPNKYDDASEIIKAKEEEIIRKINNFSKQYRGTPIQLVICPWCGHKLVDEKNPRYFLKSYRRKDKKRRIYIYCPNDKCSFCNQNSNGEGLPVIVTDEEIYRLLPDMVIGTVDKFARMPWEPKIQNLFGKVKGEVRNWGFLSNGNSKEELNNVKNVAGEINIINSTKIHPPNIIIQDELHLISGPLGTMVGLYETAVDYLSSVEINGKKIGPKIIASTATIKNAFRQIEGLYTRRAQIFPSPGLTHNDSFFARQRPLSEMPGRVYVGIFAPGRSIKTAQVRIYANLLSSVTNIAKEANPVEIDPYQTLVGYFNSIRELGGAVRLIEDDVPARMKTLQNQFNEENLFQFTYRELDRDVPELTSRIESGKIPELLSRLQLPYYERNRNQSPIDVLLASNMISVGVDVSRLGLMVVNGQPKSTAEYIQSTSRVGRKYPGLIITIYNWARPRDISHYEEFFAYHAALYRYVEPISVTPFASRARDRGLAAVLVAMLRLGHSELSDNNSANKIKKVNLLASEIMDTFLNRANKMGLRKEEIENHLQNILQEWEDAVDKSNIVYHKYKTLSETNLLYPIGQESSKGIFKTPNSMRDVEPTAGIYIRKDW